MVNADALTEQRQQRLDLSETAVRQRASRARKKLKSMLEKEELSDE